MTIMGHTIVGATMGTLAMPKQSSLGKQAAYWFVFIFLALLPDLPIPYWGHERYVISHSLFVNLGLIAVLLLAYKLITRKISLVAILGVFTILSHLLLDSFYNHGLGVLIFWPFSEASLVLPIPWLSVQQELPPPITFTMLRIWLLEFVTFSPFLLVVLLYQRFKSK